MDWKWKKYELGNESELRETCLKLFFQYFWSKLSFILFLCFLNCSFISNAQRTFVGLTLDCTFNDTKNRSIQRKNVENIEKCLRFNVFHDRCDYPSSFDPPCVFFVKM